MTAAIALFLWACGNKTEPASAGTRRHNYCRRIHGKTESDYFPVYDFLRNEVEYVDSLPMGIMKYTITGTETGFRIYTA